MKLPGLLFLLLGFSWHQGRAQVPASPEPSATVVGTVYGGPGLAQPLGKFRQTYPGGRAPGGNFGLLIKPGAALPFEAGVEVSYLADGISKRKIQNPAPPYTIKTSHSYIPLHAVLRVKPPRGRAISPFADGLAGITIFNTRSKIKQDFWATVQDEEAIVLDKHNATVFSYGLGGGLQIKGKNRAPGLTIRLVYLEGLLGTYVKDGDFTVNPQGYPVYRLTRSETSLLLLQLNLTGTLRAY